jgi:hypothetical protein
MSVFWMKFSRTRHCGLAASQARARPSKFRLDASSGQWLHIVTVCGWAAVGWARAGMPPAASAMPRAAAPPRSQPDTDWDISCSLESLAAGKGAVRSRDCRH